MAVATGPGSMAINAWVDYANDPSSFAGSFNGNVQVRNGTLTVDGAVVQTSDSRLKKNIRGIRDSGIMDRLRAVRTVAYEFKTPGDGLEMRLPEGTHYGVLADELEVVFPELVHDVLDHGPFEPGVGYTAEVKRYKGVNYIELIPLLLHALQEQQVQIDALKAALEKPGNGRK